MRYRYIYEINKRKYSNNRIIHKTKWNIKQSKVYKPRYLFCILFVYVLINVYQYKIRIKK